MASDPQAIIPAARDRWIMPVPAWRVTLDGLDLTDAIAPRLVELSLTEKRGEEADSLTIRIGDEDGAMALPPPEAVLAVAFGWKQGSGIAAGLVDKGLFRVGEVAWDGAPDIITLTALSADLTADLRKRRDQNWVAQSLAAIVATIAKRHGLTPHVHPLIAGAMLPAIRQKAKSDIAFIAELGRRYEAVATIKAGTLILSPVGVGTTPAGAALSPLVITRAMCTGCGWTRKKRDEHDGVEAEWHDQGSAARQTVRVGAADNARRLKRTYASESDARAAAEGARRRDARTAAEFTLSLALGDATIMPERPISLSGFKSEIDADSWQVAEVTHRIDGRGGFMTEMKLDLLV